MNKEKITPVTEDELDNIDVTITTDEGEISCKLLSIFTVSGKDYCAVLPRDSQGRENADGEVYLYRYLEDTEGIPSVEYIADDEEYEAVADRFDEILDEELFDSM